MANDILAKMAVQISAQTADFNKKLKDSSKDLNSFSSHAKTFGSNVEIAGQNVGALAGRFTSLLNPATAAAAVVTTLGAAYLNTHAGAEALEEVQFTLQSAFEITGREVSTFVDTMRNLSDSGGDNGILKGLKTAFVDLNPIVLLFKANVEALDYITGGYISKIGEETAALAALKGIYDDLLRDRIIESEQIATLDRQIEILKTDRVEENVSIREKIALDRQIIKLEEDRFLILVANAERRRQALEAEADQLGGVNNLNDEQLKLLIDTRNEVKNLEAEYNQRIRKIRKELTGLLQDIKSVSDIKFTRPTTDTGDVNFPGEFMQNQPDAEFNQRTMDALIRQGEAVLGLGDAYNTLNFNVAQFAIDQEKATEKAEAAADTLLGLTSIGEGFAASITSGQQNAVQALGNATLDIVSLYQKQALAAAIAKSIQSGGPLPVGLALAGVALAAVRGLFNRNVGSIGGGGGSAGVSAQPQNIQSFSRNDQIELGGTIEINGEKLLIVLKNAESKQGVRRG